MCETNPYRVSVGKPEEKRLIGRRRRKRVDNITIYLIEIVWGVVHRIYLAQDGKKSLSLVIKCVGFVE